jgi:hypothetical protein
VSFAALEKKVEPGGADGLKACTREGGWSLRPWHARKGKAADPGLDPA